MKENQLDRKTNSLNLNKEFLKGSASEPFKECHGVPYGGRLKNLKMLLKALLDFKIGFYAIIISPVRKCLGMKLDVERLSDMFMTCVRACGSF